VYNEILTLIIHTRTTITARQLSIQFGCVRLENPTQRLLEEYKQAVLESLHDSRKGTLNFDNPVYLAAAFCLQAMRMKVSIDRSKLLSICSVADREFSRVKQSMLEVCFPAVAEKHKQRQGLVPKITRKKPSKPIVSTDSVTDSGVPKENVLPNSEECTADKLE
jgi:hypothetical protein